MARFRKIVEVEAELYKPGMEDGYACYELNGKLVGYYDKHTGVPRVNQIPAIRTLEGWHEIGSGDWIITGVRGERYPCKPNIFEQTYELVEE